MSSNEKIPDIDEISDVARIPLDFQEEPAWERSHASVANVTLVTQRTVTQCLLLVTLRVGILSLL